MESVRKTGDLLGLSYIYGGLSNLDGQDPLDYETMMANPSLFEIVATNADTGEAVYFSKNDFKVNDYRVLAASSAIPVLAKPIFIDGKPCFDGGLADSIPVQRAIDLGYERIVVILSKPLNYVRSAQKGMAIVRYKLKEYPKIIEAIKNRHINYNNEFKKILDLENQGKIFIFAADESILNLSPKVDPKEVKALYDQGLADFYKRKKDLEEFLNRSKQ